MNEQNQLAVFQIKQATRQTVKPLIGFYGKSGSGKSMSALLVARGLAGPTGRVTLIDSEGGRGSLFADIIPGGYQVIDIEPPFSPTRYQEAFEMAEAQSDVVIVDSLSHEHAGEGGILDMQEAELQRMAGDDWKKREACKMASWIKPKQAHKKFIQRLLRGRCALICCLRGEEKTHILKEDGKSKVITDQFSSPIFDHRFLFELLVNFETIERNGKGGFVIPRKVTHPAIADLLPAENEKIGIAHGQAIAQWAAGGKMSGPQVASSNGEIDVLKTQVRAIAKERFSGSLKELQQWAWDNDILDMEHETLSELSVPRLREVVVLAKLKLQAKEGAPA